MAQSRGRPSSGPSIISLLSDRYKEPDTARTNVGMVGAGKPGIHRRTEETTYSFSQEEEIRQDGRTVYKTKEEKSFSGKPQPWPGDSAAPAPKVSIKTITLSTKSKDDGQPSQLTNSYGGLQKDGFTSISGSGQPHRQDYQYQQTVSTKTQIERSGFPQQQQQQPQIHQIHQQSVYQQQKQPTFGQQRQQPGYQQQQQQTSYTQQQQQQSVYGQQKQPSYAQQQPSYGQQKQPTYAQPSYGQQQQQPSYAQQKQQPSYGQQKQPSYAQPQQQPTTYGQQQQPSYAQQPQQSSYGQQKQPSYAQPQQPQQPSYAQQRQQQQAAYSQPKPAYQQQQPQQQPQPNQTQVQQQQRPGYQLLQQQLQQQEQQQQQKQQASYQQQQQRQQQQVTSQQQQQRQQQQVTYQQQQQPQQQQATYQQQQQPQQQQVTYQQQQPQQQRLVQQQQQQRQQQVTYQQQQQPQPQQPRYSQPQQPSPPQQQYQQSVHSGVYRQGQPSKATVTTITATSTTSTFAPPPTTSTTTAMDPFSWEDEPEEGVHENVPEQRPDLVRESDRSNWQAELPSIGQARNLKHKFLTGDVENKPVAFKKELTPPSMAGGGVFENQPVYNPDVVHAEELQHEPVPERGTARSMVYRFKEMGRPVYPSGPTPAKREITPDRTTRGEYVSEPRGYVEQYQGRPESGVFESQPLYLDDVIKADEYEDDRLPERGLARSMAGYFREVGNYRPAPSPSRPKEFTPPREEGTALYGYGVYENMPLYDPTVVHAEDQTQDVLPERGMARTIVTRFRKMSSGDSTPKSSRGKKEFTPPRDGGGVYENTPTQFIPEYNRRPESGILENEPQVRYDVVRSDQPLFFEEELPERGTARSLVTTWRHKERSAGATPTGSGKPKEFTPPREEPRVLLQRASSVGYDSYGLSEGSVHPYDLPGQYQPQAEACVFESQPVHLEGVVREADTDWMEGMPRNDTTRKMVAKFRHIQHQAATSADAPTGLDYSSPGPRPPLPPSGRQAQNIRY